MILKKSTENTITSKNLRTIWVMGYDENRFEQPYLLRANKIELRGNELYFYIGKELILKVWLKEDKLERYKDINEALKDANIVIK